MRMTLMKPLIFPLFFFVLIIKHRNILVQVYAIYKQVNRNLKNLSVYILNII
jgi:hypothetical protein